MSAYRQNNYTMFDRQNSAFPPVIKWLLLINGAMFVLPLMLRIDLNGLLGLVPVYVWHRFWLWQLVTYMFMHGGLWHILMNMFILWMFGSELERTWGSREFFKFYIIAGIGAGIFSVILAVLNITSAQTTIIGASGAIYGILVAYAMLFPDRYVYIYFMIPVKVKYLVIFLVALEFFSRFQADGVAHFAHLGGALVAFLYLKFEWRWKLSRWSPFELYNKMKAERMARRREEGTKIMEEVDAILDKINRIGYDNLTRREKKTLEKASDNLSKRGQN